MSIAELTLQAQRATPSSHTATRSNGTRSNGTRSYPTRSIGTRSNGRQSNGRQWLLALIAPTLLAPMWLLLWGMAPHPLTSTCGLFAVLLLVTCSVTDLKRHKIHNWATYSALLWAFLINGAASLWTISSTEHIEDYLVTNRIGPEFLGAVGIAESMAGAVGCFAVVFLAFSMARGGAGDVKLAAAIGALLGFRMGLLAVSLSYIVAAAAIVVGGMWQKGGLRVLKAFIRQVGAFLFPSIVFPPTKEERLLLNTPMPLAPSFAVGTLLVLLGVVPL